MSLKLTISDFPHVKRAIDVITTHKIKGGGDKWDRDTDDAACWLLDLGFDWAWIDREVEARIEDLQS